MASRGVADPRFEDRGWVAGIASPGSLGGFIWDIWISLIHKNTTRLLFRGLIQVLGHVFFWLASWRYKNGFGG